MARKKETITLSIPPGTKEKLEAIARRFQIMWGKSPSPSGLITAIAEGELEVGEPFTLNPSQRVALQQAVKLLKDSGHMGEAQTLLTLLLERGNLDTPLRQSILQEVGTPETQTWRALVDHYSSIKQPFIILYRNAQETDLEFTVRYAQISFHEKRYYLDIWCDQTEDIKDTPFPELIHNRCLRLDRIQSIVKTQGQWREEGLDSLEVYLHFSKGMVKAYESRDTDISNEVVDGVRQVIRRVSNPFWLIREVLRYGQNCVVISPENVRQQVRKELKLMCQQYDLD
jgi:predicted DNA-binding transcriptional regulator YafY